MFRALYFTHSNILHDNMILVAAPWLSWSRNSLESKGYGPIWVGVGKPRWRWGNQSEREVDEDRDLVLFERL